MRGITEGILGRVGLRTHRSVGSYVWPMVGIFGAGLAVGTSLGLLFAPKAGHDLRRELGERVRDKMQAGKERVQEKRAKLQEGERYGV